MQSLERAFSILEAVAERPAGVTALSSRLDLPKSTVVRLLGALERVRAVERVDGRRWGVGEGLAALAGPGSPGRGLAALARPELEALVGSLGEDAGLALPDGYEAHYVEQVECDHPVQVRDWSGTQAPMHAVPSGHVFLAEWPADALQSYVEHGLVRLTTKTVTDPARLRRTLAQVRKAGYAWGREEFAEGINSVAAPVRDEREHVVAAIHVHGPAYRFPAPGDDDRVASEVVAAARAVSRQLAREER
jgi:DNA-binding IclR family transcriptional regulator